MEKISADIMHLAAVPFRHRICVEKLKILVRSVNKAYIEFLFAELFKNFLLDLTVIPNKAEISADDESIALFQLFDCR